ncbi:MAG: hypothetical protein GY823_11910, partial [Flavobacteriaceae bacterium]|nr:hypothetical protein [Flavobacteriaceae bacterium]
EALAYIDDLLLMSFTKEEMFTLIDKFHELLRISGLKASPEKTEFFLRKVKFLGHIVSEEGTSPVAKKVEELKNLKPPENKRDVMRILGCLNFYSKYIRNLHVRSKIFCELIKNETIFEWTQEHQILFQQIKDEISADTVMALPNVKYPFFIHCDSSNVGVGAILIQEFPHGKRILSFNSRIFNEAEQKLPTLSRELTAIIFALETYEHLIIGSPHPIYVFTDHKPILYLWAKKGQLTHRFFRYQQIFTKFQNLQIVWTPGQNLAFP